jgi:DNA-binding ferritin-like protein
LPLRGRRIKEAEEALFAAKNLILKVKRMGIDTEDAEKIYLEAKASLRNKKVPQALERIEIARKTAKTAYAKGIKGMLEIKITRLKDLSKELDSKNLNTPEIKSSLKEGNKALSGGVMDFKSGYKTVKEGLRQAEAKLTKYRVIGGYLGTVKNLLRPMEDYNPTISKVMEIRNNLDKIENDISLGKIENAEKEAKQLKKNAQRTYDLFKVAHESINAFKKVLSDAQVLGARIEYEVKYKDAESLLLSSKFRDSSKIADWCTEQISTLLVEFKDVKHDVDSAREKVKEVKGWGFSAFESENILKSAEEALKNHDFESAKALSADCLEKAQNIRERHKQSLELLQKAKEKAENMNDDVDTQNIDNIISEAEDEFNRGNYQVTMEKLNRVFEALNSH